MADTRYLGGAMLILVDDANLGTIARAATIWERLHARVLGASFDRRLAAGAAPETSAALEVRALALVRVAHREVLADSIEKIIEEAAGPTRRLGSRVVLREGVSYSPATFWRLWWTGLERPDRLRQAVSRPSGSCSAMASAPSTIRRTRVRFDVRPSLPFGCWIPSAERRVLRGDRKDVTLP
jgi:hypothetical protein